MKKRLMMSLAAGALMAAMLPGGVVAGDETVSVTGKGSLSDGQTWGPVTFQINAKVGPNGKGPRGRIKFADIDGQRAEARVVDLCAYDLVHAVPNLSLPVAGVVAEWGDGAPYSGRLVMVFGDSEDTKGSDFDVFPPDRLLFVREIDDAADCFEYAQIVVLVGAVWNPIDGKVKIKGVRGLAPPS